MTQPPEYVPDRTETQRLADDITHQASIIRREWPRVLPDSAPGRSPGRVVKSATITLDDDDTSTEDIDAHTRLMHMRRNVTDVLNQWCRLVMDERPITNPVSLPLGNDVPAMAGFLERQADWLAGTDHGEYCLEELRDMQWQVSAYTDPYKREWYRLGYCPFIVDDAFCGGAVRVKIGDSNDEAACARCDQAGPIDWWHNVLNGTEEAVSASSLAKILSTRIGVSVDERTIRRWAKSDKITPFVPFGPQPEKPRYWFMPSAAIDEVARMDRSCPTCGAIWSGRGDVCYRCYSVVAGGAPKYTTRADGQWVKVSTLVRKSTVTHPRLDIESDVCAYSDLPKSWCACERHAM